MKPEEQHGGGDHHIIAVVNQKGGVGKTTTAAALADGLAERRAAVLRIDADPQGNLSKLVGSDPNAPTLFDALIEARATAAEAVQHIERGDIIASSPELMHADHVLMKDGMQRREYRLKDALEPIRNRYDYIIIDTPPSVGLLTLNALTASTDVIITAQPDAFSLDGLAQLYESIKMIRQYTNPDLSIMGIVITRYIARAIITREAVRLFTEAAEQIQTKVFDAKIRESIAIKEAQIFRRSIYDHAPNGNTVADYDALIDEITGTKRSMKKRKKSGER